MFHRGEDAIISSPDLGRCVANHIQNMNYAGLNVGQIVSFSAKKGNGVSHLILEVH